MSERWERLLDTIADFLLVSVLLRLLGRPVPTPVADITVVHAGFVAGIPYAGAPPPDGQRVAASQSPTYRGWGGCSANGYAAYFARYGFLTDRPGGWYITVKGFTGASAARLPGPNVEATPWLPNCTTYTVCEDTDTVANAIESLFSQGALTLRLEPGRVGLTVDPACKTVLVVCETGRTRTFTYPQPVQQVDVLVEACDHNRRGVIAFQRYNLQQPAQYLQTTRIEVVVAEPTAHLP